MRHIVRSTTVALFVIGAAILMAFQSMITSMVALTATALYMGGTGHPLSIPGSTTGYIASYVANADAKFVRPSGLCTGGVDPGACTPVAVYTPAQFRFDTGLRDMTFDESVAVGLANLKACLTPSPCTVTDLPFTSTGERQLTDTSYTVFGYSQSGTIAGMEKSWLIAHPPPGTVSFVLMANPNRPNGGILERFVGAYIPILGVTFNGPTPTNSPEPSPLATVDIVRQYDPVSDFPTNPLNLLADLNALVGFPYLHPEQNYFDTAGTAQLQGRYQDTTYYLIPTTTLPLLMPLARIPIIGPPLAAILDPPLRVLVEAGYNRTINPGQPTPAKYLYFPNPIKTAIDFLVAIPTGWDNGIAYITGNPANRPFHTTPQPTYGVGGPPVDTGAIDPYGPPTPALAPVQQASTVAAASVPATSDKSARIPAAKRTASPTASVAANRIVSPVDIPKAARLIGDQPSRAPLKGGRPKTPGTPSHSSSGGMAASSSTGAQAAA